MNSTFKTWYRHLIMYYVPGTVFNMVRLQHSPQHCHFRYDRRGLSIGNLEQVASCRFFEIAIKSRPANDPPFVQPVPHKNRRINLRD